MPRRKIRKLLRLKNFLKDNLVLAFLYDNPEVKTAIYILMIVSALSFLGFFRFGPIKISDDNTLTVIGTFSTQEYNRVATYIVTISGTGTEKGTLIKEVNEKTVEIIESAKDFGINHVDIKTTNNYIYEVQDPAILKTFRTEQKVWKAGTSVEIKLKDLNKAEDFTILLTSFSNTELYGPTFSLDEKDMDEAMMLSEAVKVAKKKAIYLTDDQNKRLGKIISIEEISGLAYRAYGDVLGLGSVGGSSDYSPGSTKVTKTVKVKFKLY